MASIYVCYSCDADLYTLAYLFPILHVANIEVGTQQANGADCRPQYTPTCLESSDYRIAGRPGECKNITLMPFLADILTLK